MKQTVIDILIYLFENYIDDEIELGADQDQLKSELREAGFDASQVAKAFEWLQGLATSRDQTDEFGSANKNSMRFYASQEELKLDAECRGFLYFLEQVGVLDGTNRELVIDRVMALDADQVDISQLKWIVLMVLFNQPGHEQAFIWMEDLLMDDLYGSLH